jgi:hypothetical protein
VHRLCYSVASLLHLWRNNCRCSSDSGVWRQHYIPSRDVSPGRYQRSSVCFLFNFRESIRYINAFADITVPGVSTDGFPVRGFTEQAGPLLRLGITVRYNLISGAVVTLSAVGTLFTSPSHHRGPDLPISNYAR